MPAAPSPSPVEVQPQPTAQASSSLPAEAPAEPADQPPPVGDWEVEEVQRWAESQRGQEWPRIVEKLREHEVDGDMLLACKRSTRPLRLLATPQDAAVALQTWPKESTSS